jgi:hypothetical protein
MTQEGRLRGQKIYQKRSTLKAKIGKLKNFLSRLLPGAYASGSGFKYTIFRRKSAS